MMSLSYFLSPIAEQDIEEIITYIAEENSTAAYDFIDALYAAFSDLAKNPYMGHKREDLTNHPVRFWTFKWHYLVVYKPSNPPGTKTGRLSLYSNQQLRLSYDKNPACYPLLLILLFAVNHIEKFLRKP